MEITDAQVHIWALDTPQRPWPQPPRSAVHRSAPFYKEELLGEMNAAGVKRVVIVPPSWEGDYNDLALDAAASHPDRFGVMGRIDTDAPDALAQLAAWRRQPGMLGLRFTFARPELQAPLEQEQLDWLWPAAEKAQLPVMMIVRPDQLRHVDRIAQRHPGLKLVMDHLALYNGKKGAEAFKDLDQLIALAKRPNVAAKASGIPHYATDAYPYPSLHSYLQRVYDAFGPKRMFWGTDMTKLSCTYRQAVTMFTEELSWLKGKELESVMGKGLCEWLGWKTAA
jgi:predicted TIM-barrel fold metal-dependent hydrolase